MTVPGVLVYRTGQAVLARKTGTGRQKNRHCMTVPGLPGYRTGEAALASQPGTSRHCMTVPGLSVYRRGLQFYTFFGISIGITRRLIDIGKKITFYFLQNV